MRYLTMIVVIVSCFSLVGCGSSTKQKAADNELKARSETRIKLINEYKACVAKANGDTTKAENCTSFLKAAETIK